MVGNHQKRTKLTKEQTYPMRHLEFCGIFLVSYEDEESLVFNVYGLGPPAGQKQTFVMHIVK